MSMKEDIGYLKGKMESAEQNSQIFQACVYQKLDKVLGVASTVKRHDKSINKIWGTLWTGMTCIAGGSFWWHFKR